MVFRPRYSRSYLVQFFNSSWSLKRLFPKADGRRRSAARVGLRLERLEDRLAPAVGLTVVDDNWALIADNDASGSLSLNDTVRNSNDTLNTGTITRVYGVDGFGTVSHTNSIFFAGPTAVAGSATINDAIANTVVSGTVDVLEGTYSETATVNKSVTVEGAQHGVDARNARGVETILDGTGNSGHTPFSVTANDVILDGFTVQGATNANVFGFGIVLGAGTSGATVANNVIQNNIAGLSLANNPIGNSALIIQHNLFQNNNQPGPVSGTAIYTDQFNAGGNLANVTIDANTFTNNQNVAVLLGSTVAASQSNITISNNTMTGNGNGVLLFNSTSFTIFGNTITGSTASQVVLGGGVSNGSITQNFIQNGVTRGIRIGDFGGGGTNQNVTITQNSISGNPTAGLEIDAAAGAYTGTLDATNNWWGSPTGPTIASNPGGTGDKIIDPNSQVTYSPFLLNGTDTAPGTPGFQPNLASSIFVNGTAGNDTLVITITGPNSGSYSLNGGAAVPFSNVFLFTFDGGAGTDTLVLDNTPKMPVGTVPGILVATGLMNVRYPNVEVLNINNATSVQTFAGPDTADRTVALAGLPARQRFVQALYLDELGRAGSAAELNSQVAVLNGSGGAAAVARGIQRSREGRDHLVKSWYLTFLGRAANGTEEMGFVNALLQGRTEEDVLSGILGSGEFFNRAQTLIASGTANERFVQSLYLVLLNRTASASEVTGHVNAISKVGLQGVARNFLGSSEYRSDQFEGYYDALLHRPSDVQGLNNYVFSNSDVSSVRLSFEVSSEFFTNG